MLGNVKVMMTNDDKKKIFRYTKRTREPSEREDKATYQIQTRTYYPLLYTGMLVFKGLLSIPSIIYIHVHVTTYKS